MTVVRSVDFRTPWPQCRVETALLGPLAELSLSFALHPTQENILVEEVDTLRTDIFTPMKSLNRVMNTCRLTAAL